MNYLDVLSASKEPLIILLFFITLINVLYIFRMLFKRDQNANKNDSKPLETIVDIQQLIIQDSEMFESEIRPIEINGEITFEVPNRIKNLKKGAEIRTLLAIEGPNECDFCSIFKGLNSVVCPNCGRPLNPPGVLVIYESSK